MLVGLGVEGTEISDGQALSRVSSRVFMGHEGGFHITLELQRLMRVSGMNDKSVVTCLPEITDHVQKAFIVMSGGLA